jgi:integrase
MVSTVSPRSLTIREWPAADRLAWEQACRDGERLRRGGRASHLRPVTRDDLARRYGLYLDFLGRRWLLDQSAPAGSHVTLENVEAFMAELRERVSSVTQYGCIYKLRRATEIIAPAHDVSWLRELEKDLDLAKQPRSKMHRVVLAEALVKAGLTLMIEADRAMHRTALQRATQYRIGLMIALLACCPIRLKNFTALSIGSSIVQVEDSWWIVLTEEDTKEKRPDERRVPDILTPCIDQYVSRHRPVLTRCDGSTMAFWIAKTGKPLDYSAVAKLITQTAALTTGIRVSPHLFRTSAATTAAIHADGLPDLASGVLGHRDARTTEQHYNRATSLSAAASYGQLLSSYLPAQSAE